MLMTRVVAGAFSIVMLVFGAGGVSGQIYPNKPIRIVTTAAGGGSDFTARLIAQGISGPLGQPVIVDNQANGIRAAEVVSKAAPDGYSLLVGGASIWIVPLLQKAPYDFARDFSPLSLISREVNVLVVHPSIPVKSVKELIALAKAKPGELNYGSTLTGGPSHLGTELFKSMAGVDIVRIVYKGAGPAITALISGEVQMTFADPGLVAPYVKLGRLKALAVTSAEPSALAPGLPTVAASGLPGYELTGMSVIFAPAKTPGSIISRLNQEIVRLLNLPDVKERMFIAGSEIVGNSPEQFEAIIKSDIAKVGKVIKDAGIKLD